MNRRKPQNRLKAAPPPKAANTSAERRPRLPLRAWREQHLYSFFSSLGRMIARPWATVLTVLVMALALTLPLLLYLVLDNARQLRGDLREAGAISVFVKPHLDDAAVEDLARRTRARAGVANVVIKTPEQGLQEFRKESGFADALDVLRENPLPAVLVVTPATAASDAATALVAAISAESNVDLVQYDAAWRRRLDAILGSATRAVEVLAGLLALALLLVVGNTVRLDIQSRAEEISVMQLLGAGNGFVRRPFLYAGVWYGALSAVLALIVTVAVELMLAEPLRDLVASYDQRFAVHGLGWQAALAVPAIAVSLGWLGAWLAASRHLWRGRA